MPSPVMITDRDWKIGEVLRLGGKTFQVTMLESHPIGIIPWIVPIMEDGRVTDALKVLAQAAKEREWEDYDDPTPVLDQLVPYATVIADFEGHHDVTMVLERELEL